MRMNTVQEAIDLFRRGDPRAAEAVCLSHLARDGDDVDTLSLLAEILSATGRHEDTLALLERIIALQPNDAAVYRRQGGALLSLGRADEAIAALRRAIRLDPTNARAHNNLGQALIQLHRIPEAIASHREALRLEPAYAIALNNLGLAYAVAGEHVQAVECFERALTIDPPFAAAGVNLGIVLDRSDRLEESLRAYDRAVQTAPELFEGWVGRGSVLAKLMRYDLAIAAFDKALTLRPGDVSVMTQKAMALLSMEDPVAALAVADAALSLDARSPRAHNARAGALRRLGRRPEALKSLERALALDPEYVDAWRNHGTVLHEMGVAAAASCHRAIDLEPNGIQNRTRLLARLIPSVPRSSDEAGAARAAFDAQLLGLRSWLESRSLSEPDALTLAQQQFFYLSYQEQCNRALLEEYRGASARRLGRFDHLHAPPRPRTGPAAARRFRLGLISAHVHDHSVFNAITSGWLQKLDRQRFEISLFSVGTRRDSITAKASESVARFEAGTKSIVDWTRVINGHALDAIIFPEIGMNETTLGLASLRLAERQYAAWGHPETTGLPTIDGYLSAELFEPPRAETHYTEPLVRLPHLGVYCERYEVAPSAVDIEKLGLERTSPIFICPGVPFKYQPQDDAVFIQIASRLGACNFVFFQYEICELTQKLQDRLAAAFERAGLDPKRYLRFIPWQPRTAFFALLRQADVYLDTIGFSGFNTLIQAVECNLPCVSYDGRFMRGRLGSGILRRLELPECIAIDTTQYVDIAVHLAQDARYRAEIRAKMLANESRLYRDVSAVDALAEHLLRGAKT